MISRCSSTTSITTSACVPGRGFRNLKVYDAILDHSFGDADAVRLLGRRVYLANYSTMRHHAARNRLIVVRRYGFGRWFWEDAWFTWKAWVKLLLLEKDRGAKIAAALRGAWAGLRYPVANVDGDRSATRRARVASLASPGDSHPHAGIVSRWSQQESQGVH
jgi:hypothetical protein